MPKAAGKDKEMDGVEKAAILLIALGPEKSAQIFKHLKEDEIEQLTLEIANTSSVSPQTKEMVLNEFYEVCLAQQYIAEGGISYAKELLEKALGEDKAGCYQQADSIITGKTVRVCQKDRSEPAVKLYSGRASADHRFNSFISAGFHVFDGSVITAAGETGRCSKKNCTDGQNITGCYQAGRKSA